MNLRKAFLTVSLVLAGMLGLIAAVTLGSLHAFNTFSEQSGRRQSSLTLMNELSHEVDLLGRLAISYVSTANPRYLIYYYDILAVREGRKPRPELRPAGYWDQVIAGSAVYEESRSGQVQALSARTEQLGFDAPEQGLIDQIRQITETMKETEQIAFAATQGLYDPQKKAFVSEFKPQPQFASALLYSAGYLKSRADLSLAVEQLAAQVDQRTASRLDAVGQTLRNWILSTLLMLVAAAAALIGSYRYLQRHLLAPLISLHRAATALAAKSYSERLGDVHGVQEVQSLATTIDEMAAAIEQDLDEREQAEQALRLARAKAEVATEAKSIFLANMSHEIRTPMNAILGMAYLAMNSGLKPRQLDYVEKIHSAARSLLGILNDVLDFSKIEAGKLELDRSPFDLETVVENALFMVQQRAEERGIELILDYELPDGFNRLLGDQLRFGQILINLLANAVKFTDHGHVRLIVRETARVDDLASICCIVEDTGIGMEEAALDRLFSEFSQADDSTTRKYGGTGLGLSISQRLAEAMDGKIEVESAVDRGSRFCFSVALPVDPSALPVAEMPENICSRALVLDDYAPARESVANMLRRIGCCQVDQVADGDAALLRLQEAEASGKPYDLFLLDWVMPEPSGQHLFDLLAKHSIRLPQKTVVVSIADAALMRSEVMQPGLWEIIQKPVLPKRMRQICAARKRQAAESSASLLPSADVLSGMQILLVEDNAINQQVASEILCAWGAGVDLAADGQQALDCLSKKPAGHYALVLMDIEMPVMDGLEATRRLRADPRLAGLPVIAMTAHALGADLEQVRLAGMNGRITKPFEPDDLLATLRPYLRRVSASAHSASPKPLLANDESLMFERIAALPGIDVATLERRFHGRTRFLNKALRLFADDAAGFAGGLQKALADGDVATASRQVHTFKGLAGTFALDALHAAAKALELALKNGDASMPARLADVEDLLQPLLESLNGLLADDLPRPAPDAVVDEVFALLQRRLREGDGDVEELWNTHRSSLSARYTPTQLARIDWAIRQWNFDAALEALATNKDHEGAP